MITTGPTLVTIVHTLVVLTGGLLGGVYFAFSASVMPGLRRLPAAQGIAAMRAANAAILNPAFMLIFFGAPLGGIALAILAPTPLVITAAVLHVVPSLLLTMLVNVPLNNALDAADARDEQVWKHYVRNWTLWNTVRAVACAGATLALVL
ncbi:DUF1772 domain-containing protein [Allokutzneria sp. A3M-2-11 16]|uniref:anthrone oxygenase family protein n=1 Tax=Allokutzneria sp. A3M-2-11 16 TaxID=2962043 RepID=UPI0020B6CD88|nr:anthrone oxygenase family protein [Allokutzneria sp. A3M-2-11 16]MCP3802935.1 DUF1772 domain-containing protein [Allokutzneria sp. A3M-2-11 16]